MSKYALMPELTDAQRDNLADWIAATLESPELVQSTVAYGFSGKFAVYKDGAMKVIHRNDYWLIDTNSIYLGYRVETVSNNAVTLLERLAVVGAIISLGQLWERFHEAFIARAANVLFTTYEGIMSGMIQTEAAVNGLAFNADKSLVAGKIGDSYHLPNGDQVEIDDTWTVVLDRPNVVAAGEAVV